MAYADQQMSGSRIAAIIIVALIHIALGYALVTGLAYSAVRKAIERVTTVDIKEPPPEKKPPPPPKKEAPPPPIVAPPPPINIAPAPPPIQTQPTIPPPAPPVLRVPPPAPPAPPSRARGASPKDQSRWAARIQGDYPSAALRRNESGTVTMQITISTDGRVQACNVVRSSGSSSLDTAACRGMQRYARYNPALNDAGDPITSSTTQAIRYVLPDY